MIVGSIGRVQAPAASVSSRAVGLGFSVATPVEHPVGPAPTAPAAPLDGMLALQEREADVAQDRRARQHGQAVLQALAALQHIMLSGGDESAGLRCLTALTAGCPAAADPRLGTIIQAVMLRARVELARRGL